MKPKTAVTVLLLSFVGASLAYLVLDLARPAGTARADRNEPAASQPVHVDNARPDNERRLIAYYFHGNQRCATCRAIEQHAREALEESFPDDLSAGRLVWRTVNIDEPANRHYADEYELTSSTVVLADTLDGAQTSWRRLDRVWELARDELKFKAYVESEAAVLLETGP